MYRFRTPNRIHTAVALLGLFTMPVAAVPPANDTCTQALELAPGTATGSTVEATPSQILSCFGSGDAPDVWFRFTADEAGRVFFHSDGSSFPTTVAIFSACPEDGGAEILCVEGPGAGAPLELELAAGDEVLLRLAGAAGSAGSYQLTASLGGTISGRVSDETGQPIAGAAITLAGLDGSFENAFTDADGLYARTRLAGGVYVAYARPPADSGLLDRVYDDLPCPGGIDVGCDPLAIGHPIELPLGTEVNDIDFILPHGGAIAGRVTREDDGEPIADLVVVTNDSISDVTDSDGRYRLAPLEAGSYIVRTLSDGIYIDEVWDDVACDPGSCPLDEGTPVAVELGVDTQGIDFALASPVLGTIRGRVSDAVTGEPLLFLRVEVRTAAGDYVTQVETRSDGTYSVDLAPGSYIVGTFGDFFRHLGELWPDVPCSFPVLGPCDFGQAVPIELAEDEVIDGIDLTLDPGGTIRGKILDATTGEPIDRLDVGLWNAAGERVYVLETNPAGVYELPALTTGQYYVATQAPAGAPWINEVWDDIPCPAGCDPRSLGQAIDVTLNQLTRGIGFVLERRGAEIAGTVRAAADGRPLDGVLVQLFDAAGELTTSRRTGVDGRYEVLGLEPGTYFVRTAANDAWVDELWDGVPCVGAAVCDPLAGTPIILADGQRAANIDFQLAVGGAIAGEVTEPGGAGIVAVVEIVDQDGRVVAEERTAGRAYEVAGLPPGTYFARTRNSGFYVDEVWDGVPCLDGCPATGTPILVDAGQVTMGIDFVLRQREGSPALRLDEGRFYVEARWQTPNGQVGEARAIRMTADSGYFWFFNDANVELVVKVLDACVEPFNHFWVFAAGLTNVGVDLTVTDQVSRQAKTYRHALGTPFQPILDTETFGGCPENGREASPEGSPSALLAASPAPAIATAGESGACTLDTTSLCLNQGRFRVRARWRTGAMTGVGHAVQLTTDTGFFWFFDADNLELVVKVLDACQLPSEHYWVFAGGLTNVAVQLEVTDTVNGEVRIWESPDGVPFAPILDTAAFATCDATP